LPADIRSGLSNGPVRFAGAGPGQSAVLLHRRGVAQAVFASTDGRVLRFGQPYPDANQLLGPLPGLTRKVSEAARNNVTTARRVSHEDLSAVTTEKINEPITRLCAWLWTANVLCFNCYILCCGTTFQDIILDCFPNNLKTNRLIKFPVLRMSTFQRLVLP
jgi:hypothetical protein